MKVVKSIFWLAALGLCLFHLGMLTGHSRILALREGTLGVPVVLYWGSVLAVSALLVTAAVKSRWRRGKMFLPLCLLSTAVLGAGMLWYLLDAPSLSGDFEERDIRPVPNGTYRYLKMFNDADIEAFDQIRQSIEPDTGGKISADRVDRAWEAIRPYRQAVAALDRADAICDLPPGTAYTARAPLLGYTALATVADIYILYSTAAVSQGKALEAVETLACFHRVACKGMTSSVVLLHKMIFVALADRMLDAAYASILEKPVTKAALRKLRDEFPPYDEKIYSLERVLIGEYLLLKNTIRADISPQAFLDTVVFSPGGSYQKKGGRVASAVAYYFSFHPNRSLRHMRQMFDLLIQGQRQYPPDFTAAERFSREYAENPPLRNMAGWILNTVAGMDFSEFADRTVRVKVKSDLLAAAVGDRLKAPVDIPDLFTGKACRFRKDASSIRHPGEDGEFGTRDDIVLGGGKTGY